MWLKYEAKGGSLLTVLDGKRVNILPGAVIKVSTADGADLMESSPFFVVTDAPVEEVAPAEVEAPAEESEEPTAMGEMSTSTGPIGPEDIPDSGRRGRKKG